MGALRVIEPWQSLSQQRVSESLVIGKQSLHFLILGERFAFSDGGPHNRYTGTGSVEVVTTEVVATAEVKAGTALRYLGTHRARSLAVTTRRRESVECDR